MPVIRRRAGGDSGAVAINLIIVLGFALYAVIQLTRVTLAAKQIDDRVVSITETTPAIDATLDNVPKLNETDATAKAILEAATPLTGHLDSVIGSAGNIDNTVSEILSTAQTINGTVTSIGGLVDSIQSTVNNIESSTRGIDSVVPQIRQGVITINNQADIVIDLARNIRADLDNVLANVGGPGAGGFGQGELTIAGHANSIDCAALGSQCQR